MPPSNDQSQRELVFCHSCENEWYRDEHGLECPECHSDVVEIIEANHDPRQEMHEDDTFGSDAGTDMRGLYVPDPDEEDIRMFDVQQAQDPQHPAPMPSDQPYTRPPPPNPPRPGNAGVHDLLSSLFQQIGPMNPWEAMQHGAQANLGSRSPSGEAPPVPHSTRPEPGQQPHTMPGMPHVQRTSYQLGPMRINTYSTSQTWVGGRLVSSTSTRGPMPMPTPEHPAGEPTARFPSPGAATTDAWTHDRDISGIMDHMMRNIQVHTQGPDGRTRQIFIRAGGNGQGTTTAAAAGFPMQALFAALGMGRGGGDFVHSDEEFDRFISQMMENQHSNAPGPATQDAIDSIPRVKLSKEMIGEGNETAECGICLADCEAGEEVAELPCKHWYHFECIKHWLESHDSCPSCRRGIMPQEGDGNRPRTTGEPPLNWQMPNLSRSNTHQSQEGGDDAARGGSSGSGSGRAQRERDLLTRTRSPAEPQAAGQERQERGQGFAEYVRNGIVGWMGRHLAVGQPAAGNPPETTSGYSSTRQDQQGASRRHSHARSRDPRNSGLDNPDVD